MLPSGSQQVGNCFLMQEGHLQYPWGCLNPLEGVLVQLGLFVVHWGDRGHIRAVVGVKDGRVALGPGVVWKPFPAYQVLLCIRHALKQVGLVVNPCYRQSCEDGLLQGELVVDVLP